MTTKSPNRDAGPRPDTPSVHAQRIMDLRHVATMIRFAAGDGEALGLDVAGLKSYYRALHALIDIERDAIRKLPR